MPADRLIRAATALVVTAVAAFAAVVSYSHIYDLGRAHGQSGAAARLLPLSVDGLILAASLVLLDAARRQAKAPLAQAMLWLGIGATLAANALYGLHWGTLGVLVSAWPAVAFIGSAEMLFWMVRSRAVPGMVTPEAPVPAPVPAGDPLLEMFRPELEAGSLPGIRKIKQRARCGSPRAVSIRSYLAATLAGQSANGHGKPGELVGAGSGPMS
jgi:hypothetical protein